jgi:hypothetical protein
MFNGLNRLFIPSNLRYGCEIQKILHFANHHSISLYIYTHWHVYLTTVTLGHLIKLLWKWRKIIYTQCIVQICRASNVIQQQQVSSEAHLVVECGVWPWCRSWALSSQELFINHLDACEWDGAQKSKRGWDLGGGGAWSANWMRTWRGSDTSSGVRKYVKGVLKPHCPWLSYRAHALIKIKNQAHWYYLFNILCL